MKKHKISIIVPVYNVERYLERCLDSILNQDYSNWELIIIDDGSKDRSGEICDSYAEKDARIRVKHMENGGVSNARNTGIDMMSGDYCIFVDSDDWLEPDMLSKLYDAVIKDKSDMSVCECYNVTVDEKGQEHKVARSKLGRFKNAGLVKGKEIYKLFFINTGTLWNKLIKSELVRKVYFNTNIRYGEDTEYLLRLVKDIKRVSVIPYYGYNYFINRQGNVVSSKLDDRAIELIELGEEIYHTLAARHMGMTGVFRVYSNARQLLMKIPKNEKRDPYYRKYYARIRKSLHVPTWKDKVAFVLDKKMEKKIRLEYIIKCISVRTPWLFDSSR